MRWVDIKNGIKQRIGEILGTSDNAGSDPLNNWSVQAAMLENSRRIVKSLVGDSSIGRPMKGCVISAGGSGQTINITSGFAFTSDGNIIVFGGAFGVDLSSYNNQSVTIRIKHENIEIPGDTGEDFPNVGKSTGLIGKVGTVEIVNDDSGVNVEGSTLVVVDESHEQNYCYLGSVSVPDVDDISTDDIENASARGLSPNLFSAYLVNSLTVNQFSSLNNVAVSGTATLNGQTNVNNNMTVSDSNTMTLPADSGKVKVGSSNIGYTGTIDTSALTSVEVKNGLIVGTPS